MHHHVQSSCSCSENINDSRRLTQTYSDVNQPKRLQCASVLRCENISFLVSFCLRHMYCISIYGAPRWRKKGLYWEIVTNYWAFLTSLQMWAWVLLLQIHQDWSISPKFPCLDEEISNYSKKFGNLTFPSPSTGAVAGRKVCWNLG